jgi:hypothetical protein
LWRAALAARPRRRTGDCALDIFADIKDQSLFEVTPLLGCAQLVQLKTAADRRRRGCGRHAGLTLTPAPAR